ncbi:Rv1733c family protein [Rhodococcus marinonascens]|uniref:Rv1733c family protein n=1 Tax=Rhodococcus marinonascens TaxID=38311 RepID=UPI000934C4BC|nr:hypothetical protein [Rhodococcus marinonascens]
MWINSHPRGPRKHSSRRDNPLLRRSDRIERRLTIVLVLLAFVMLPLAVVAGARTIDSQTDLAQQQAAQYSTATATTLAAASSVSATSQFATPVVYTAPAEWAWGADVRQGNIAVDPATSSGTHEQIWVDTDGNLATKPMSPGSARVAGVTAGLFTWFAVMTIGSSGFAISRTLLNRARYAQWDREIRQFLDSPTRH